MARCFVVRAITEFSSAHILYGYPGACERTHGHNFEVECEVEARDVDEVGMAIDFTALEQVLAEIAAPLDHRLLNEVPPFTDINPTAENLAAHFWAQLEPRLSQIAPTHPVTLVAMTVRENRRTSVTLRR